MDKFNKIEIAKQHFLEMISSGESIYSYLPQHVIEAERWAEKIMAYEPTADRNIVLFSIWLHDIGQALPGGKEDHSVASEIEVKNFLPGLGLPVLEIEQVAHCVRAHRCRDVQPKTLEAKIVAAADSASHMTDIVYLDMVIKGAKVIAIEKLERDYRDVGLFPKLQKELEPVYLAWRELLRVISAEFE